MAPLFFAIFLRWWEINGPDRTKRNEMRVWISKSPTPFLLAIAFGMMLVWVWWVESSKVEKSHSFQPATATLTAVIYAHSDEGADNFYYEGVIDHSGTKFKSSRISFGNVNSDKTYTKFVEEHPVGSNLRVFVNPNDSSEVIVYRGKLSWAFRALLIAGLGIFGGGVLGLSRALFHTLNPSIGANAT